MVFFIDRMDKKYIVYVHITPDGLHYYGVSIDTKQRWRGNGYNYKRTSLRPYIEKFGWKNIQHIVLFENLSKEDALSIEDSLIVSGWEKGNCINKNRSGKISKEENYRREYDQQYREKNKDKIKEQTKQYYEDNKDKIKQYREQNKEQIMEKQKQYYEKNKDKIIDYQREYCQKNKDKKQDYYKKNRDKIREQRRQRYQRKKEEKQLKNLGYIPLF